MSNQHNFPSLLPTMTLSPAGSAYQLLIEKTIALDVKLAYYKTKGKTANGNEQETGNTPPG